MKIENIEVNELTEKGIFLNQLPKIFKNKRVFVFDDFEDAYDNNIEQFEKDKNIILSNNRYESIIIDETIVCFFIKQ
jgi:hypothetical protein